MARTLVSFHAHPDDEAIATGGVIAAAAEAGHRVVLVVATRGEHGEVADGFLADGESLAARREAETLQAARILGIHRVEFLGYVDSGMQGEPQNHGPGSFCATDVEEAARRVAAILDQEQAEVLTVYDENGVYGHPDHVQVHRVGVRAAEIARTPRVYEGTMNRDQFRRMIRAQSEESRPDVPEPDPATFGLPEARITTAVDVTPWLDRKRRAMAAHASQIGPDSMFMTLPDTVFRDAFGTEWFVRRGAPVGPGRETSLW